MKTPVRTVSQRRHSNVFFCSVILLALCGLLWDYQHHIKDRQIKADRTDGRILQDGFDWDQVTPTIQLYTMRD